MTNNIGIVWSSDDRELIQSFHRQIAELQKENAEFKRLTETGKVSARELAAAMKKAAGSTADVGKAAEQVRRSIRSQMEVAADEYRKGMTKLRGLQAAGGITDLEYGKARRVLQSKFLDDSGLADQRRANEKKLAEQQAADEKESARRQAHHDKMRSVRKAAIQQEIDDRRAAAERVRDAVRTGDEKAFQDYKAAMARLRSMRSNGDISDTDFQKAWQQQKRLYQDAIGLTEKRTTAERKAASDRKRNEREAAELIRQTMTVQDKLNQRVEHYRTLLKANMITEEQFAAACQQAADELNKQSSGMDKMAGQVAGMVTSWLSIHTLVRAVNAEIQAIKYRQKEAGDVQVAYGRRLFDIAMNFGPDGTKPETLNMIDKHVRAIARERGAEPLSVAGTFGTAIATRVGGTIEDSITATRAAVGLSDDDLEREAIAASLQNWKSNYPGMSMNQIVGATIAAKQIHPTKTHQQFAEHVAPFIASSKQFDTSLEDASALFGVIAGQMGDTEGRISTNAALALQEQLKSVLPQVQGGPMARIQALQTDEFKHIRQDLLGAMDKEYVSGEGAKSKLEGERKAGMTLIGLVNAAPELLKKFDEYKAFMPKDRATAEKATADFERLRAGHPLMQPAEAQRRFTADVQLDKLADPQGMAGVTRDFLINKAKSIGDGALKQWMVQAGYDISSDVGTQRPLAKLQEMLASKEKELRGPRRRQNRSTGDDLVNQYLWEPLFGLFTGYDPETKSAPKADVDAADRLRVFIQQLAPLIQKELEMTNERNSPDGRGGPNRQAVVVPPVNVNLQVNMPGGGEKAAPVAAAGLGN